MKRYLTGIDWVINSIDYAGKAQSGIGNISQVVLELDGDPDAGALRDALACFLREFPFVRGSPGRGLNLCPYWRIVPGGKAVPLRVREVTVTEGDSLFAALEAPLNQPFEHPGEHLVFDLIRAGGKHFLGMTFDHRLLDARGAEAFLDLFQRYYRKQDLPPVALEEDHHLDHWGEKFRAGKQVNRAFLKLTRTPAHMQIRTPLLRPARFIPALSWLTKSIHNAGMDIRTLPVPSRSSVCKFKTIHFDPAQAAAFTDAAYARAGYLMLMPYALARSVQAMHRVFQARKAAGSNYIIPVSIDTRPQEAAHRDLFFNHVSFLLFKLEAAYADNLGALAAQIKEQMYEQIKAKLPEALQNASLLLRIAPLPLVNVFLRCMSKKRFASFSFSFVGGAYTAREFMGNNVLNIFHLPRVPNPPGVGIFFNQSGNRMNAALSYFDGSLSEVEAGQVAQELSRG